MHVLNRHGAQESLDLEKIHKVLGYACDGVSGVSVSEIELRAQIQFYEGIKTQDIHNTLIKSTAELISEETPNYDIVGARLVNFDLRKQVYGQYQPTSLYELVKRNVRAGKYDSALLSEYNKDDWTEMESFIKYERDDLFKYAGMVQMKDKYLVQDRTTKQIYETPQVRYMVAMAAGFMYDNNRIKRIKAAYDACSTFKIGLPTPVLAGLGTPTRQFSSCVKIDTGDNLDSISASSTANIKYVSLRAGLGNNHGRIRALNSTIRNGEVSHTGLIPFIKLAKAAVKSCSQGGIRGGAMTTHYPIWHLDVEDLLVLKNNKGTEETRERHIDYNVQWNGYLLNRVITGKDITLFSPELPGLYEAFFSADTTEFAKLYEQYEKDNTVRKKTINGKKLMDMYLQERTSTGRIYMFNADNVNRHTPFNEKIYMVNLCCEIALPTVPFNHVDDTNGRIALCTLANFNFGTIKTPAEFEGLSEIIIRLLDNILSMQDYPMIQAKLATEEYRPLAVGVNNLAFFLAKNGVKYSDGSALELVDEWFEAYAYYLQKATIELAKERGACKLSGNTKRAHGQLTVDTYCKNVDKLVPHKERLDWNALRKDAIKYGVRNATVTATMPSESNSVVMNSTNGVEPIRELVTTKVSGKRVMTQVAPQVKTLKNKYELLWNQKDPTGYLHIMAILQKYTDQAISVNTSYNPLLFDGGKVPMSLIYKNVFEHYKYGGKTLYYSNTLDDTDSEKDTPTKDMPAKDMVVEDDCESCKI